MPQVGQLEAKPQRQSQVQEQVSRLEDNLTALHDNIGKLQDRLSSVLRQSAPSEQEKGQERAGLVVFADTIEGFGDSVKSATYKIEDILERLEL
jgi:phage shock protein A